MKAFMSDPDDDRCQEIGCYGGLICESFNAVAAYEEAKRILAVTEPKGQSYNYDVRMYDEILAEALRAFVESPGPEGYLISDQPMAG